MHGILVSRLGCLLDVAGSIPRIWYLRAFQ
jgi:hypothetical protein